jgi:SSS family transporter
MAIMLLLPAITLSTVTGLNVQTCILTMGLLCIIYTVLGGIEAVIWNDCLQVIVLLGGALLLLGMVWINMEGGLATVVSIARADAKLTLADFSWDWTIPALWVVLIGNMLSNLPPYITDQAVIQRYLTTPDIKQARQALWFNVWFLAPNGLLFFVMGTSLYAFYKMRPELLNPTIPTDAIVPWFVVQNLPAGICGLVIASIFAASMSSLDSSIHAVATTIVTDFYRRFKPGASETFYLRLARALTIIIGLFGTITALIMAASNIISLWEAYMKLLGLISGGIAGIFLLGILTRRSNGAGAFIGAIASALLVFAVQTYTSIHFFLYGAIGVVSAMIVGYLASIMIPAAPKNIEGLTVYKVD